VNPGLCQSGMEPSGLGQPRPVIGLRLDEADLARIRLAR